MTWYNVLDYNVSFHETDIIYIWLHIGSIKFVEGYNKVEVNNITYSTRKDLPYKTIETPCFAEKVKLSFDDSAKAHLFITQLERAL